MLRSKSSDDMFTCLVHPMLCHSRQRLKAPLTKRPSLSTMILIGVGRTTSPNHPSPARNQSRALPVRSYARISDRGSYFDHVLTSIRCSMVCMNVFRSTKSQVWAIRRNENSGVYPWVNAALSTISLDRFVLRALEPEAIRQSETYHGWLCDHPRRLDVPMAFARRPHGDGS